MAGPLKEKCRACGGVGTVPRMRRQMENGEVDPSDFRWLMLCENCGGGGMAEVDKKKIEERRPGNIADQIGDKT